jgi:hypothetical protein
MRVRIPLKPKDPFLLPSRRMREPVGPSMPRHKRAPRTFPVRLLSAGFLLSLILESAAVGQTLRLSPAAASPGDRVTIEISFEAPPGKEPQALQWEATIPSAQLSFADTNLQAGQAAQSADKSCVCALKTSTPEARTMVCILAGGLKQIPNGVVALLRLQVLSSAGPGPALLRTERGIAVMKGPETIPLAPAEAVVTVRQASKQPN